MIVNFLYELPLLRGQHNLAGKVLGGWQVSGIFQAQSGAPWSVGRNQDYAGVGQDGSMNGSAIQYWGFNGGDINYPVRWRTTARPIPATGSRFRWARTVRRPHNSRRPATGTFVTQNIARNVVYGPGLQQLESWPVQEVRD